MRLTDTLNDDFFVIFRGKRSKNARHTQKSVTTAFCSRVASDILRSAVVCLKQLFVQSSGTKELAFHATTATGWTPLKQHLSFSAAWTAVCCDFIGAGSLFRITTAGVCAMTSNGNPTLAYLLSDTREIMHHCNFNAGWSLNAEIARESSCKRVQRINYLYYAECSWACAKRMFERSFYLQVGNTCCSQPALHATYCYKYCRLNFI